MQTHLGELELIRQIRTKRIGSAQLNGQKGNRAAGVKSGVVLGMGDDCAILQPPRGHEIMVTTDFSLEGRHFVRSLHPPESIGHRVLVRGLSDLAAMGAEPLAAFLSLALPREVPGTRKGRAWLARFFAGFNALAARQSVSLAGGDTSESPSGHVLADIILLGSAPAGRALRRSTARAGDALYVTGHLGGSAAELALLKQRGRLLSVRAAAKEAGPNPHPHLYPRPRLMVGQELLRRKLASACIDLSDGLSTDLQHLCEESHLGAVIEASTLPIHPFASGLAVHGRSRSKRQKPLSLALHGGEDYELLFAAPAKARVPGAIAGVPVTRIGTLTRGKSISLIDSEGRRTGLNAEGWEHFAPSR